MRPRHLFDGADTLLALEPGASRRGQRLKPILMEKPQRPSTRVIDQWPGRGRRAQSLGRSPLFRPIASTLVRIESNISKIGRGLVRPPSKGSIQDKKKPLVSQGLKSGAGDRGRTDDLMLGKHTL